MFQKEIVSIQIFKNEYAKLTLNLFSKFYNVNSFGFDGVSVINQSLSRYDIPGGNNCQGPVENRSDQRNVNSIGRSQTSDTKENIAVASHGRITEYKAYRVKAFEKKKWIRAIIDTKATSWIA